MSIKYKGDYMKCEFKYCKHIDLVYHILNHMHVQNSSDLYSQKYVDSIQMNKKDGDINILEELRLLEVYYNDNFERLTIVNFLPFYSNTLEELKGMLKEARHLLFA